MLFSVPTSTTSFQPLRNTEGRLPYFLGLQKKKKTTTQKVAKSYGGRSYGHESSKTTSRLRGNGVKDYLLDKGRHGYPFLCCSQWWKGLAEKLTAPSKNIELHVLQYLLGDQHIGRGIRKEGNGLSPYESRDFFPPGKSSLSFNVTSAVPPSLPFSLNMRGTRPGEEGRVVRDKIKPPSYAWNLS